MTNDALISQGSLQGIYGVYQTTNGKTSWKSTFQAIWYVPDWKDWAIGKLENIGNETCGIWSNNDEDYKGPSDIPDNTWKYYNNGKQNNGDGNIMVQCINDQGKFKFG